MPFPAKQVGPWMRGPVLRSNCAKRIRRRLLPASLAETARARARSMRFSKREKLHMLTHMSEIDDRDLALADKGLAGLRNHRRTGAAAHGDNRRVLFSEISRSFEQTLRALSFSPSSTTLVVVSARLSTFSISLFYRRAQPLAIDRRNEPLLRARGRLGHPV